MSTLGRQQLQFRVPDIPELPADSHDRMLLAAQVIDRISNRKARDFLHAMPPKPGMPFDRKFPNADPQALHLLSQLLSFDASERPTAAQALEHPYFKTLPRVPASDVPPVSVEEFHFEMHRLSETDVRNLIYLEVRRRMWLCADLHFITEHVTVPMHGAEVCAGAVFAFAYRSSIV